MPPAKERSLRIMFLARALTIGGAERQLVVQARGLAARGHRVTVCVFYGGGPLEPDLARAGVQVVDLQKRGRGDSLRFIVRLCSALRSEQPDVLHGFLVVPNIFSALVRWVSPKTRLVWGVRSSMTDFSQYDPWENRAFGVSRWLSRRPDLIIANSNAGARAHAAAGYPERKLAVVHNGIDTARFRYDPEGRARLRRDWQVGDAPLIGLVARLDPVKDHPTFLRAVAKVQSRNPATRAVCIGDGAAKYRAELIDLAASLGANVRWETSTLNVAAVYSALDVACSTSWFGEGFSNALAGAIERVLAADRRALGRALRARVESNFDIDHLVRRTESLLVAP